MTNNDLTSRLTSRRGFLATAALGASGLVVATATGSSAATATARRLSATSSAKSCISLTPTEEIGPFYVAENRVRRNLRDGQAGVHLALHIKVIDVSTCQPIHHAALDIWHANAVGVYSDEQSEDSVGKSWCRGIQLTDTHGRATFHTIMPGWYEGRVEHIHAKVRLDGKHSGHAYTGGTTAHIGQMFFPQKVNDAVAELSAYAANHQDRITNATDRVYTQQSGSQCVVALTGSPSKGYVAHTTLGIST